MRGSHGERTALGAGVARGAIVGVHLGERACVHRVARAVGLDVVLAALARAFDLRVGASGDVLAGGGLAEAGGRGACDCSLGGRLHVDHDGQGVVRA